MAYTSSDAQTRLDAVRVAIDRALSTQAYTARGRSNRLAELKDMRAMEKELQQEVANSGQMATVGRYVRPR